MSIFPSFTSIGITFIPARIALAGFVPCADFGIRQSFLFYWPIALKYLFIVSKPAY